MTVCGTLAVTALPNLMLIAVMLTAPPPAFADSDGFARKTMTVTPRVHLIYRPIATDAPYEGNSIVIEQSDGLVVVDAGGSPPAGRHIVAEIKSFSAKTVKYLIYTHYHGDHNLGAGAFLAAWPNLTIVSTEATRTDMTGKPMDYIKTYGKDYAGEIAFAQEQLKRPGLTPTTRAGWQQMADVGNSIVAGYADLKAYPATLTFGDRLTIPDSETPVAVMFLGKANTDGDAVVWVESEKVICTGDIVVEPLPYAAASFPTSWTRVLNQIEGFDFAYLIPGHGDVQKDHVYLDKVKGALAEVQRQVAPLAKNGVSLDDAYKQTDFKALMQSFTGDDNWRKQEFYSFFLHSIIKNSYFEATGQPIVQGTS
jgi:glyoxylase-like metal-dependent hydrolase (beta-lactamase superfamily II)